MLGRIGTIAIAGLAACGARSTPEPDRRGVAERREAAERHEQRALEHATLAERAEGALGPYRFDCGDDVLNEQSTTGGLPVAFWQPCFDIEDEARARHLAIARREWAQAQHERRGAEQLVEAARLACAPLPEPEREHSVFDHRRSIERVGPVLDRDGQLIGARVVFAPTRGLNAAWLGRSVQCHRARWRVIGRDPAMMPNDPTLVDGARVAIRDIGDRVEVVVTAPTVEGALVVLARARGQLDDPDPPEL
jgi:hypothetical protein